MIGEYAARPSGSAGYEVLANGTVIAWTVGGYWAAVLVTLLHQADADGLKRRPTERLF